MNQTRSLKGLPKAELHLHLEGAMRRSTLVELCTKYDIPVPMDTAHQSFEDFSAFVQVYVAACSVLKHKDDVRRLVLEVAEDALENGTLWMELAPSFTFYADNFGGKAKTLELLVSAAEEAERITGVGIGYIISVERHLGIPEAEDLARVVLDAKPLTIHGRPAIIGFGLHGPEEENPPAPFQKAFEIACGSTEESKNNNNQHHRIASMPHAGEIAPSPGTGAQSVMDSVCLLKAKRIAHGVLAANDETVLQAILDHKVCLDVCVSSNFLLNVVKSKESHPLPQLIEQGVPCTINSDDPLLFGPSLLSEYELCRNDLKMSDEVLAKCAKASFEYSCAPEKTKATNIAAVDTWLSSSNITT